MNILYKTSNYDEGPRKVTEDHYATFVIDGSDSLTNAQREVRGKMRNKKKRKKKEVYARANIEKESRIRGQIVKEAMIARRTRE